MSNKIIVPYLNPVKFVEIEPTDIPQYVSRHMDDWLFKETIRDFEQPTNFIQPWLMDDSIRLQYRSNFAPLNLKVYSCDGELLFTEPFETRQQDALNPGYYIRQVELDLATFDPGFYYFRITELDWISELMEFKTEDPNTLYIEFTNSEFYGGLIFDSPFSPTIRIPAILKYKNPGSKDTIYSDQDESEVMLKSHSFRVWNLIVGGQGGVPPWLIDKISRMLGCDSFKIDGREYTKNEGAQWEAVELDGYPMAGWSIELREKSNRDYLLYEDNVEIIGKAAMAQAMDSKGFGVDDSSGDDFLEVVLTE